MYDIYDNDSDKAFDEAVDEVQKGYDRGFAEGYAKGKAEADPTKHGRWLWFDGVRCSICNHKLQTSGLPSYCPNCGARMDETDTETLEAWNLDGSPTRYIKGRKDEVENG